MEAPANIPPIIASTPARQQRVAGAVLYFGCVLAAIAIALVSGYFQIAFPACSFKSMTGLPCAFCGGTRCLRALGHLHFTEAFWFNPLVTVGVFVATACAVSSTLAPRSFYRVIHRIKMLPLLWIGLGLVAANWIFVIKHLPR